LRDKIYAQCLLEASGGITIDRMPAIGASGVDYVSVGALTHSAPAIDIGLDFDEDVSYP
jgi:nicotinate-nucleotide pyrophosphorylase (carboxylating)